MSYLYFISTGNVLAKDLFEHWVSICIIQYLFCFGSPNFPCFKMSATSKEQMTIFSRKAFSVIIFVFFYFLG